MTTDKEIVSLIHHVHIVQSQKEYDALTHNLAIAEKQSPVVLAFVNAHAVNLARRNKQFTHDLLASDVVLRDGSGMKLLYAWLARDAGFNMNGTDYIPELLKKLSGKRVAIFGTDQPYLDKAAKLLEQQNLSVVSCINGFQENQRYLDEFVAIKPDVLILAMGMPKQERISQLLKSQFPDSPVLIICGGAIIDFMAGKVTRAPKLFRRLGIEWLYRLLLEPKRLFKRYIIGNFSFILYGLRLSYKLRISKKRETQYAA